MNFLLMNKIKLGWLAAFMYDIKIDFFGLNINIGDLSGSLTSIINGVLDILPVELKMNCRVYGILEQH